MMPNGRISRVCAVCATICCFDTHNVLSVSVNIHTVIFSVCPERARLAGAPISRNFSRATPAKFKFFAPSRLSCRNYLCHYKFAQSKFFLSLFGGVRMYRISFFWRLFAPAEMFGQGNIINLAQTQTQSAPSVDFITIAKKGTRFAQLYNTHTHGQITQTRPAQHLIWFFYERALRNIENLLRGVISVCVWKLSRVLWRYQLVWSRAAPASSKKKTTHHSPIYVCNKANPLG